MRQVYSIEQRGNNIDEGHPQQERSLGKVTTRGVRR